MYIGHILNLDSFKLVALVIFFFLLFLKSVVNEECHFDENLGQKNLTKCMKRIKCLNKQ